MDSSYRRKIIVPLFLVFILCGLLFKYGWEVRTPAQTWYTGKQSIIGNVPTEDTGQQSIVEYNFKDLNCISTIPEKLIGAVSDMPILIPESLVLRPEVLRCLYHRYVTTVQTLCVESKLFGHANEKGGYVCVDKEYINKNKCEVYIFGSVVDNKYTEQLKMQYGCNIRIVSLETHAGKPSLYKTIRKWTSEQMSIRSSIDLLVLSVPSDTNDVYIVNELLQSENIMSRIRQISLKIYINPVNASVVQYEQWLLILKQIYKLKFRIFSFSRDWECRPKSIETSKFLSCYSVYFIRPEGHPPTILSLPPKSTIQNIQGMDAQRLFDRFVSSTQILCNQNIRVGNIKSGGWNVCHDPPYRPSYPCLVYSFGICVDWTFDEDAAQTYGCEVHSFDPTIGRKSYRYSDRVHYHNIGIGGTNSKTPQKWELRTLDSIMKMLNHEDRHLDILKMDVENAEWRSLKQMFSVRVLSKVRQLYIEYHSRATSVHLLVAKELHDLGFRIFWSRKNLAKSCLLPLDSGLSTTCFEVYYINTKFTERF